MDSRSVPNCSFWPTFSNSRPDMRYWKPPNSWWHAPHGLMAAPRLPCDVLEGKSTKAQSLMVNHELMGPQTPQPDSGAAPAPPKKRPFLMIGPFQSLLASAHWSALWSPVWKPAGWLADMKPSAMRWPQSLSTVPPSLFENDVKVLKSAGKRTPPLGTTAYVPSCS